MLPKFFEYIVGGKETNQGKGLPVDVRLSLDPEFRKTVLKTAGLLALGIGAGIATGIAISEADKQRRRRRRIR